MFQPRQYFRDIRSSILSDTRPDYIQNRQTGRITEGQHLSHIIPESKIFLTMVRQTLIEPILPGMYATGSGDIYYHEIVDENADFIYWPLRNENLFSESNDSKGEGEQKTHYDLIVYNKMFYPVFSQSGQDHFLIPSVRFLATASSAFSKSEVEKFMNTLLPLRRFNYSYLYSSESSGLTAGSGIQDDHWSAEITVTPSIRTAYFFEYGDGEFTLEDLDITYILLRHFEWPDIVILLNEGKILIKEYEKIILDGELKGLRCNLRIHNVKEDVLFLFSDLFLNSVLTENATVDFSYDTGFLHEYPEESASAELPI